MKTGAIHWGKCTENSGYRWGRNNIFKNAYCYPEDSIHFKKCIGCEQFSFNQPLMKRILLIILTFSAFLLQAQVDVQVIVLDGSTDAPKANLTVTISSLDYGFNKTQQTDSDGKVIFKGLQPGTYFAYSGNPEKKSISIMERAMRFELTTPTLARLCSTTELRPQKI